MKAHWLGPLIGKQFVDKIFGLQVPLESNLYKRALQERKVLWPNVRGRLGRIQSQICGRNFGRGLHPFCMPMIVGHCAGKQKLCRKILFGQNIPVLALSCTASKSCNYITSFLRTQPLQHHYPVLQ